MHEGSRPRAHAALCSSVYRLGPCHAARSRPQAHTTYRNSPWSYVVRIVREGSEFKFYGIQKFHSSPVRDETVGEKKIHRIAKAYSTLMISSTYPGPPSMPRSVTLAKPKNKGKSYTTFLKPIVSTEWLRQI